MLMMKRLQEFEVIVADLIGLDDILYFISLITS